MTAKAQLVRLANELLVEVIAIHIGDTLDFFWVFLFFFIYRLSYIVIHLHVLFFVIGLNHLRSTHI